MHTEYKKDKTQTYPKPAGPGAENEEPAVSIIIVSWNTQQILQQCLRSIYKNVSCDFIETIVIDNASSDGSADMVATLFPQTRLIRNSCNLGFARAINQGLRIAKGRYVLLLNSDTIVLDPVIHRLVEFADKNPRSAVVGCQVLNPDHTVQNSCFMFPSILNMLISSFYFNRLFPKSRLFGREQMTWWDRSETMEVDAISGCCMLVRRQAIREVGFLDDGFFMYAEETDWCYRFKQAGWHIFYAPVGSIIHLGGQSSKQVRAEMIIQLRLSILRFIKKHHGPVNHQLGCLLTAVFFALRLPAWALISIIGGSRKHQAPARLKAYATGIRAVLLNSSFRVEV